jgi:DNA replication protein DnaC
MSLVFDPGTGKSHLATFLVIAACRQLGQVPGCLARRRAALPGHR